MGHKHSRETILEAAMRVATEGGLHGLSFRRVADEAGTSDRMVVYYFADKPQLLMAVLEELNARLEAVLLAAVPSSGEGGAAASEIALAARPVVTAPEHRAVMRLFLEALGLAAAGVEPFASGARELLGRWAAALATRARTPGHAAAALATIDGMILLGAFLDEPVMDAAWEALRRDG